MLIDSCFAFEISLQKYELCPNWQNFFIKYAIIVKNYADVYPILHFQMPKA